MIKIEAVDSKYEHELFKFLPKNTQIRYLRSKRRIFYFAARLVD